ncbi:hypothetical protein CORC01_07290 [Colletotrichum orchidophilum]|uniref:Uncharacterized protein n=1 Tax=Colletotrichum orchidophilum TaxID=1209926 RepID=A0A1G4B7Z1_9PEZI|nr:uncharacterized protein CORC01_07290 [Colletotrichum orchidophilum]OHE97385.1 hypothetical protein CORC01_07290 [Colletotrichum orchidophilum]
MGQVKPQQQSGKKAQPNGRGQRQRGGRGRHGRKHRTPSHWSFAQDFAAGPPSSASKPWVSLGNLDFSLQRWMRNGNPDQTLANWGLDTDHYASLEDRVLADIALKWPDATVSLLYEKTQEAREHVYHHFASKAQARLSLEASDWFILEALWIIMNKAQTGMRNLPENRKYSYDYTYSQLRSFASGPVDMQYAFYLKKYERSRTPGAAPTTTPMSSVPAAGSYLIGDQTRMPTTWMAPPPTHGGLFHTSHGSSFVPMPSQGTWMVGGGMGQAIAHGGPASHLYASAQHLPGAQQRPPLTYY